VLWPVLWAATAALIGLAVLGAVLHEVAPGFMADLAAEDGPLENTQAVLFLVAAAACGWGLARRSAAPWAWPLGIGALLLFGEEISWGQRLIGFSSPAAVAEHNRQHEFNVHNLAGVNESIRDIGVVLLLVAFLAVPALVARHDRVAGWAQRLRVVVPGALCATTAVLAIAFMRIPRWLGRNDFGFDECGELFLALTVLLYAWQVAGHRRLSAGAAALQQ
jgi:type IV secretory pathway VirB2 component (pilin)